MRVLVVWGSKRGGTEGIAQMVTDELRAQGVEVVMEPAAKARADGFDAVIAGGALYANRWHRDARRFIARNEKTLRHVPVWLFSSGPLDDSADGEIPPVRDVRVAMERVGARAHVTFGGRLTPDARGFPASAMAKQHAGDWRRPMRIRAWADGIAHALPTARPRAVVTSPGRSIGRLIAYGLGGWALCAAAMALLLSVSTLGVALVIHAIAAPLVFAVIAQRYFAARGARAPLPTALTFVVVTALFDLVIVDVTLARSVAGFWVPLALIFFVTWAMGAIMATLPWPSTKRA